MEQQNDKIELDLIELFLYLKKKLLIIIAAALLFAIGGYVYSSFFVPNEYVADTRIYVLRRTDETTVNTSDFQTASYMLKDYQVLITGRNVTKEVISRLGLHMSPGALSGKINISAPSSTRVLQISVTDTDPQRAADIANAVREVATEQIREIMDAELVHLVYEADVPRAPSNAGTMKKTGICAAVGAGLALVIFVAIFALDDTIRNEEDVTHYLGLSVIGVIPASSDMNTAREGNDHKHRYRRSKARPKTGK